MAEKLTAPKFGRGQRVQHITNGPVLVARCRWELGQYVYEVSAPDDLYTVIGGDVPESALTLDGPAPEPLVVIVRWSKVDVCFNEIEEAFALFPEIPTDMYGAECLAFAHVGAHFDVEPHGAIYRSRWATQEQAGPLLAELASQGDGTPEMSYWGLTPRLRCTYEIDQRRRVEARRIREAV